MLTSDSSELQTSSIKNRHGHFNICHIYSHYKPGTPVLGLPLNKTITKFDFHSIYYQGLLP